MGQPVVGQRGQRQPGDGAEEGQLAQAGAAVAPVGDEQGDKRRRQRDGESAGGQVGVGGQAAEEAGQEEVGDPAPP